MSDGASVATVASWSDAECSGLLEADDLPGGCSVRAAVVDTSGAPSLTPGTEVAVWWSRSRQCDLPFRADRVLPFAGSRYAPPIPDDAMLAAMRSLRTGDVEVVSAEPVGGGLALVRFAAADGEHWDVELPMPSSSRRKPWLYCTPDDAEDAAAMLGIFLDEEVVTTAVRSAARTEAGHLVLAPYGFEWADPREHERLSRLGGEDGWWGAQTEGGPLNAYSGGDGEPRAS